MTGAAAVLHASLSLVTLLWALLNLGGLRRPGPARSLWAAMLALSAGEALHTRTGFDTVDAVVPPGWAAMLQHTVGLVAAIAVLDLLAQLLGRSRRWQRWHLAAGVAAVAVSVAPVVLSPPARMPAVLPESPVIYHASWQFAVHWAAFLGYLGWALSVASWQCARHARAAPPGTLRTSMALISAGTAIGLLYVVGHATIEAATFTDVSLTRFDPVMDAVTLGASIGLITVGAGWRQGGDVVRGARARVERRATRRRVELIRPYWRRLVGEVPEVSPFAADLRAPAAGLEQLHWQQTRMVTEVYDALRRLLPALAEADRARHVELVRTTGLRGDEARSAAAVLDVSAAIRSHRRGAGPRGDGGADPLMPGATARDAAEQVAAGLRRLRGRRVRRALRAVAVTAAATPGEDAGVNAAPPDARVEDLDARHRHLALRTFAFELRVGHHLAFVRTFAAPRIAGLLAATGQMEADPHRRGVDTGLFMYELIEHGLESPTGRRIVRRLRGMHRRWEIADDDYRYVLGTFCVLGLEVVDRYGWRPATAAERQVVIDWYRELGTRMGVHGVPATFEAYREWFAGYESAQLRRTPEGDRLLAATREVVLSPVPRPLRRPALTAASVLVDEPARSALGLPPPGPLTAAAVRGSLRLRAARRRRRPDPPSWFRSGASNSQYPAGYVVDELGPPDPDRT